MTANIGTVDRVVRIVVGLVILGLGVYFKSWWGLVGLLPIATALVRFCPAYTLFGVNTCALKAEATPPSTPPTPPSA